VFFVFKNNLLVRAAAVSEPSAMFVWFVWFVDNFFFWIQAAAVRA
jgi:hypothetical protein